MATVTDVGAGVELIDAWQLVELYDQADAHHVTKPFSLGRISLEGILDHGHDELHEIRDAVTTEHKLEEIADAISVLFHAAVREGFSANEVAAEICRKIKLRFALPEAYIAQADIIGPVQAPGWLMKRDDDASLFTGLTGLARQPLDGQLPAKHWVNWAATCLRRIARVFPGLVVGK